MLKLTPSGLAYLRDLGMGAINKQLAILKLPPIAKAIHGGQGFVKIYDTKVTGYNSPRQHNLDINPPRGFIWTMNDFDVKSVKTKLRWH